MAANVRRITKIVFLLLNILAAVAFLLACLASGLDPVKWWTISLLGLGFGFIVITLIAFILFWLVIKPRFILISLVPMLIGYKSIAVFFGVRVSEKFNYQKSPQVLRVADWNVARFMEWKRNNNKGSQVRLKMMDQIKEQAADVLCLQEFFTSTDTTYYNNLHHMLREVGYPYYYFAWRDDGDRQWFGNAIFSKHPIVDSGKFLFPNERYPESLLHADIDFHGDTIRVYTTHLASLRFKKEDYENIEEIKGQRRDIIQNSKGIFSKVRNAMMLRKEQALLIRELVSNDPHPTILTGDFNDVPNSFAYATIKGEKFQDVFLQKGFGIGRTFNTISPTLRIDYIFTTKDFEVLQFNRIVKDLSDHYMLVTDLQLKR
ncbi:MAG TPA: endonuclease/exonuclease/phosphatase family protein [Flavisolibacter sp.]|jgi:endonuclease/exonuclease/phosphatase family metal-dependent hydrolase|nr:endonuclease/exonuclease/phosphatase family protein [Flavisolibacter sp.]